MPTDGAHPEALRESLLCLMGQTDDDFEVLILTTTTSSTSPAAGATAVEQLVQDMAPSLGARTRLLAVAPGTPGQLRNAGLSASAGRYFVVLEEGDLVMGSWVRDFREASSTQPGRILRAASVTQPHANVIVRGEAGIRAQGPPEPAKPSTFSLLRHATHESTPPTSFAWPGVLRRDLGSRYDEDLVDGVDHELLVRCAQLVGVVDLPRVTTVHRTWSRPAVNAGDDRAELWSTLDHRPLLLPPGEARRAAGDWPDSPFANALRDQLERLTHELQLTHEHATNLEGIVHTLETQSKETQRKHQEKVQRLRRSLKRAGEGS